MRVLYGSLALGCASLTLLFATALGRSQSASKSPLQVAENLDCIIQPRFERIEDRFGMTRMLPALAGHNEVSFFRAETEQEKRLLQRADSARREYIVAFIHVERKPVSEAAKGNDQMARFRPKQPKGKPFQPYLSVVTKRRAMPDEKTYARLEARFKSLERAGRIKPPYEYGFEKQALQALPKALKGERTNTEHGRWALALRPVRATQQKCLGCHTDNKLNDTLGVMVYAVSKREYDADQKFVPLKSNALLHEFLPDEEAQAIQ